MVHAAARCAASCVGCEECADVARAATTLRVRLGWRQGRRVCGCEVCCDVARAATRRAAACTAAREAATWPCDCEVRGDTACAAGMGAAT